MSFESIFRCGNESTWSTRQHWTSICPSLHISEDDAPSNTDSKASSLIPNQHYRERLIEDGYVLVDEALHEELTKKLKDAIESLHRQGYPATFVLLYDETWELARLAVQLLQEATHPSNQFNFDILAWHVDHRQHVAGFSPHRDRQPAQVKDSFHDDQQAKYVTLWMALSNATPENSCLYVIPKQFDPGYTNGDDSTNHDDDDDDGPTRSDPLWRALSTKESFQNIRALPRQAGQSVLFTHRILHWGSRGNPASSWLQPRIAISFVCSDPSFERPYLISKEFPPKFHTRLLLVCAQLLIYYQRLNLSKDNIRACYEYCKKHEAKLDVAYRNKVTVEFVKAMKEANEKQTDGTSQEVAMNEGDDDAEEAVLEAMLDAEEGGYGEFGDDFDELEDGTLPTQTVVDKDESDSGDESNDGAILFGKRALETDGNHVPNSEKAKKEIEHVMKRAKASMSNSENTKKESDEVVAKPSQYTNHCVPLKGPIQSTQNSTAVPEFSSLVNYPGYMGESDKHSTGMRHCLMCGKRCPVSRHQSQDAVVVVGYHGVCSKCCGTIWFHIETKAQIKMCTICKQFLPCAYFGEEVTLRSCAVCRTRAKQYRRQNK